MKNDVDDRVKAGKIVLVEVTKRVDKELIVLKRALSGSPSGKDEPSKLKVSEPKSFNGVRVSKDLENVL